MLVPQNSGLDSSDNLFPIMQPGGPRQQRRLKGNDFLKVLIRATYQVDSQHKMGDGGAGHTQVHKQHSHLRRPPQCSQSYVYLQLLARGSVFCARVFRTWGVLVPGMPCLVCSAALYNPSWPLSAPFLIKVLRIFPNILIPDFST